MKTFDANLTLEEIKRRAAALEKHRTLLPNGTELDNDFDLLNEKLPYMDYLTIKYGNIFNNQIYKVNGYCIGFDVDASTGTKILTMWDDGLYIVHINRGSGVTLIETDHPGKPPCDLESWLY